MEQKKKSLIDNNEHGFILNESGTSVVTDESDDRKRDDKRRDEKQRDDKQEDDKQKVDAEEGSKSDPQLTELDGLKKGGVDPHVHEQDKYDEKHGNDNLNMPQVKE